MPEGAQQKTEKPTRRRRQKARQEGTVAQSSEVANAFVLLAAGIALVLFGGYIFQTITTIMTENLANLAAPELTISGTIEATRGALLCLLRAVLPIGLMAGAVGVLCCVVQTGVLVVPKKVVPDLNAVNPIRGLQNIFSLAGLMRLVTALVKFVVIGVVAYFLLRGRLHWLQAVVGKDAWGILDVGRRLSLSLLLRVGAAMIVVAILDYAYQRRRHENELKMTRQEVKDERKRDEGDPEIRGRQEQMRRAIARNRMMQAVPEADVVVSNPTHLAVALKWDEATMAAPTVVAKGRDHLAERIKQVARDNGVPVLERRDVARTLYQAVEVGMEIPPKLYYAVAEVLAFVLRKRKRR